MQVGVVDPAADYATFSGGPVLEPDRSPWRHVEFPQYVAYELNGTDIRVGLPVAEADR